MAREKLDYYFSVFNGHINNAHDRAVEALKGENPDWAEEVLKAHTEGIMGIFERDPTPATKRYVELVTQFVNEDAEE